MPAIITDTFDYDDIVRALDLDEAFVHHQIDALQPKYWRIVIKTKPKGFMYLDSNPLAKPEKAFFTPHFFDRYKERTGLPMDMPKMEVMKDWIMKNLHLNSDAQGNEKYPDGIFCAYPSGVALGRELPDGNSEMKTFITYDMLRENKLRKVKTKAELPKCRKRKVSETIKR
jgi:hypothetical protein